MQELPQETSRAAQAFRDYCLMGSYRSLRKLKEHYQHAPLRQLELWSSRYHWQERARQYDADQGEIQRVAQAEAIAAMNARHIIASMTMQEQLLKRLDELLTAQAVSAPALVAGLKLAIDLERSARGVTDTQRVELTGSQQQPIRFNFNSIIEQIESGTKSA